MSIHDLTILRITSAGIVLLLCLTISGYAQNEKVAPRINLVYNQAGDDAPFVSALVRKRVERKYIPIAGIPVNIFFNEESEELKMGSAVTNDKGSCKVVLPDRLKNRWDSLPEFTFIATIASSDTTEESTESIFIKRARLQLLTSETEESKAVRLVLEENTSDGWVPVEGAEVKIFVKTDFGKLPVGEDFYMSDESGAVESDFIEKLPGDKEGMIKLGGMIEDHEDYGTVLAYASKKWGMPLIEDNSFMKRSLWATRDKTPWWLLVFPNIIILAVWGVIAYLIIQIIRMKRLASASTKKSMNN